MKVIHKQSVSYRDGNRIVLNMPLWCEVISCGFQGEDFVFWYITDNLHDLKKGRVFYLFRTGEQLDFGSDAVKFIGTADDNDPVSRFVLHLFMTVPGTLY